jgi:DNA uptake protein ComE-like DNA-binding protein
MLHKFNPQRYAIRQKLLQNPYCRLQSSLEIEIAAELGIRIDVNQAPIDDWLRLPGISIHQARSLVELANTGVQFLCLEDVAAALSLPVSRIQPWQPILYFGYYSPESLLTPQRFNPNEASLEQLLEIAVVDLNLAKKIVANRQQQGKYLNLPDLQRRLNLDAEIISKLMYYLIF